jgi:GT2 family glycosyltransferase
MDYEPIGISILTNGNRLAMLQNCLKTLLSLCFFRPLVVGIFNNGSTDDTGKWLDEWIKSPSNPWKYGITFRVEHSEKDLGCAGGTNRSIEMVHGCDLQLHMESDFRHIAGFEKLWLRKAVEDLFETGKSDYLYLRGFRGDSEKEFHWFPQWKKQIVEVQGPYQRCEGFWYSNNPSLFRLSALLKSGTLPLRVDIDGAKGTENWSKPEMLTPRPTKTWMWGFGEGMFVHDG